MKTSVIIAVPDDELLITETVGSARELKHLATLETREEVIPATQQLTPDVCLLSSELPGEIDILDVAESLVKRGTRVVFLAGDLEEDNPTVDMLGRMGVSDIIHGAPTAGLLIERLLNKGKPFIVPKSTSLKANENLIMDSDTSANESIAEKARDIGKSIKRLSIRKKHVDVLDNIIAVWSPAPTGKTFVAANIAAALAMSGAEVVLVDSTGATWSLMGAPEGEDGLLRFMETGSLQGTAFQPDLLPGLYVLTVDPVEEVPKVDLKKLLEKLSGLPVIVDLESGPLEAAGTTILVADHDYNHLVKIQKALQQEEDWHSRTILVLNRNVESANLSVDIVRQAAGMDVAAAIPDCALEVLESQRAGLPAVLVNPAIAAVFNGICGLLGG